MRNVNLFIVLVASIASGCESRLREVEGIVLFAPDWNRSEIFGYPHKRSESDIAVAGAKIRLDLDSKALKPIPGTFVISDANGRYKISLQNLPPPIDSAGFYYLVIEKEEFEVAVLRISFGKFSPYSEHLSYLRKKI
jgi:hypothetical protein